MAIANASVATGSYTQIYQSSGQSAVTTMIFCNTNAYNSGSPTANSINLSIHIVPNGGAVGTSNMVVNLLPIPAGETFTFDSEKLVMASGDSVVAIGSATGITATISYMSV
jgi:hypothetical protein